MRRLRDQSQDRLQVAESVSGRRSEWGARDEPSARHCPHRTEEAIERLILEERRKHRTWGPKKLQEILMVEHKMERPPAKSTIVQILKRHGLVRKGRRKAGFYRIKRGDLTEPEHPNQVWAADFKGWFLLGIIYRSNRIFSKRVDK